MSESDSTTPSPTSPLWKWLRRFLWGMLGLILLLVIFHRPLVIHGGRWLAIYFAKSAQLKLDLSLGGTLYDSLAVQRISLTPLGPSTIESLTAGNVEVHYSIPNLISHGMPELLESVVLSDVDLVIDPAKAPASESPPTDKQTEPLTLPNWLPRRLELHHVNLVLRDRAGDVVLKDLTFTLLPDKEGVLQFASISGPAIGSLTDVSARTQFQDKKLKLNQLHLGPQLHFDAVHLDASELEQDKAKLDLKGGFFGGQADLSVAISRLTEAATFEAQLNAGALNLKAAADAFGGFPVTGLLERAEIQFSGDPSQPASWSGNCEVDLQSPTYGPQALDRAQLALKIQGSKIQLEDTTLRKGRSHIKLQASAVLPPVLNDLSEIQSEGRYEAQVEDLGEWLKDSSGSASVTGVFSLLNGVAKTNFDLATENLAYGEQRVASASLKLAASKTQIFAESPAPITQGLTTTLNVVMQNVQSGAYQIERVEVAAESTAERVVLSNLSAKQEGNDIHASGTYTLPPDLAKAAEGNAELTFDIRAPNIAAYAPEVSGDLKAAGSLHRQGGKLGGTAALDGVKLRFREFNAEQLLAKIQVVDQETQIEELTLRLQGEDRIKAEGKISAAGAMPYAGKVEGRVQDLSVFQPLLKSAGIQDAIAGALAIDWQGSGEAKTLNQSGKIIFGLNGGKYGSITAIEADIEGNYSREVIEMPKLAFSSSVGAIAAKIQFKESKLSVQDFTFSQGSQQYLTASLLVPVDLAKVNQLDQLIPPNEPLSIKVNSTELDLKKLAEQLKQTPVAEGMVTGQLEVSGSMNHLVAKLTAEGRELRSPKVAELKPATLDLEINLADDQVRMEAALVQPELLPLKIKGDVPFNFPQTLAQKKLKLDAPLNVSIQMPRSEIGFLAKLAPQIRYLEGDAALDVKIAGTLERPVFTGQADLNLPAVRLRDNRSPAIANARARLSFESDEIRVHELGGEIGGGPFGVTGRIGLINPADPLFDLRITADHLAVLRNDSLTVRINSDLRVAGPLKGGTVTGTVGVIDSRFFRDVDILPIGLPGRPTAKPKQPKPPSSSAPVDLYAPPFSLGPPFADWKFDVKIRSDTPFLVRGNLANGAAAVDLALRGTGATPTLSGLTKVENLTATLPFSRLNVETGYAYFTPETGATPRLDIQAISTIRSYTVHIYISGTPNDPKTVFSSEPPLPQEDILALLATGTTTEEITGSPDILAGRAAALVFQKLYRKVFKKGEPSEEKSVLDRFNVETTGVGRNGNQAVTATFMVGDQFHLVGELAVDGGIGGQLKYVMRFR